MRAGLGFVWGSFRLGKCRMRLGGFKVDVGSVLALLGLICARCAAGLAVAFGLLQGIQPNNNWHPTKHGIPLKTH